MKENEFMVITFILPGWTINKPVGGFKVVYEYANGLSERGHKVNIIHPLLLFPDEAKMTQKVKAIALKLVNLFLGNNAIKWFRISPKVNISIVPSLEIGNIPKGDVIVATAWQTAEWISLYSPDKGEKFYLIQHYESWSGSEERVKATWHMPLKKIVISRWLEEKAKEMNEAVVAYIPNGLNLTQFRITHPIEKRSPKRIAMLYHKLKWKGSNDGIEALKKVRREVPDLQVIFFSVYKPGPEVPPWVGFHRNPSPEELVEIYNSCAVFLCPSWSEGWPLPPAEAMACGCALVSTDFSGIREYAEHEVNALLSPPRDSGLLAANINRLLGNDTLRTKIAFEGNKGIQKYTWDQALTRFEDAILLK
jgi:glycosyltransferase involved in cell wall biosynthesis